MNRGELRYKIVMHFGRVMELLPSSEVISVGRNAVVMLSLGHVLRLCSHGVCGGCNSL